MHVLYVSGSYMPAAGGAEISMYSLLRCFAERNHRVSVFTSARLPPLTAFGSEVGINVHYVEIAELEISLHKVCENEAVDLIVTQNLWADRAIGFARESKIPSILFVRAADGKLDISRGGKFEPNFVIANSRHVADFVRRTWGREAAVVNPIVRLDDYVATRGSRSHITMVNPIVTHKGGEMFRAIAESLPDRKFLAVQGWGHLRIDDGWNMSLLGELASGLGSSEVWVPQDVDMSDLSNVKLWKSFPDMREVYGETRILLVPSTAIESVPRVAIEAMSNGIPVIGSDVGGVSEVLSTTGVLVSNYEVLEAWVEAITILDNPPVYEGVSSASWRYAASIDYTTEISRCICLFSQTISSFCGSV
jgi:glycosyltransferase involved in cell wall biosynthesis